eukprot:6195342-Pleurochrysis_carterae.AAC.1
MGSHGLHGTFRHTQHGLPVFALGIQGDEEDVYSGENTVVNDTFADLILPVFMILIGIGVLMVGAKFTKFLVFVTVSSCIFVLATEAVQDIDSGQEVSCTVRGAIGAIAAVITGTMGTLAIRLGLFLVGAASGGFLVHFALYWTGLEKHMSQNMLTDVRILNLPLVPYWATVTSFAVLSGISTLWKKPAALACLSSALGAYVVAYAIGELMPDLSENVLLIFLLVLIPFGIVVQLYASRLLRYLKSMRRQERHLS